MSEAKENKKTKLVAEVDDGPESVKITAPIPAVDPASKSSPVELPSNVDTIAAVNPPAFDPEPKPLSPYATAPETETDELQSVMVMLVVVLAAAIFYVGLTVFRDDSLIFFAGIFVFLAVRPGTIIKAKNKMTRFVKELAMAFVTCFCLFLVIKAVMPPGTTADDQAKLLTMVLWALGVRLVFFPYYNLDDPQGINK